MIKKWLPGNKLKTTDSVETPPLFLTTVIVGSKDKLCIFVPQNYSQRNICLPFHLYGGFLLGIRCFCKRKPEQGLPLLRFLLFSCQDLSSASAFSISSMVFSSSFADATRDGSVPSSTTYMRSFFASSSFSIAK